MLSLISWNIHYKLFTDKKYIKNIENIFDILKKNNYDIGILIESSYIIKHLFNYDFKKYNYYNKILDEFFKNYEVKYYYYDFPYQNGILIYWKKKKLKYIKHFGLSIGRNNISNKIISNKHSDRPCIGIKYYYNNQYIYIIGVHLGHNINKTIFYKGIEIILNKLNYIKNEKLIIVGDFNEFYLNYRKKSLVNRNFKVDIYNNNPEPSTNLNIINSDYNYKNVYIYDLLYTNINDNNSGILKTEVINNISITSDHYPIVSQFKL